MQENNDAILEKTFFQESVSKFKTNRTIQITSIFIALALISIPAYSMYSKYNTPEDHINNSLYFEIKTAEVLAKICTLKYNCGCPC